VSGLAWVCHSALARRPQGIDGAAGLQREDVDEVELVALRAGGTGNRQAAIDDQHVAPTFEPAERRRGTAIDDENPFDAGLENAGV